MLSISRFLTPAISKPLCHCLLFFQLLLSCILLYFSITLLRPFSALIPSSQPSLGPAPSLPLLTYFAPLLSSLSVFPQYSPSDSCFFGFRYSTTHVVSLFPPSINITLILSFSLFHVHLPPGSLALTHSLLHGTELWPWTCSVTLNWWIGRATLNQRESEKPFFPSFSQTLNVNLTFCTVSRQTQRQCILCLSNLHTPLRAPVNNATYLIHTQTGAETNNW